MHNYDYLSELSDEQLLSLSRAYLERQAKEWLSLKSKFTAKTGMSNVTELDSVILKLIPRLTDPFAYYAFGLKNELELRSDIKEAARLQVLETWPHLQDEKKISVSLAVISMYALTVFMAHGIQSELHRVFSEAVKFSERNRVALHRVFQDENIYMIFIYKTEKPESYRKKLGTIFAVASPARTSILFRRTKLFITDPEHSTDLQSPPSQEEKEVREKSAISFLKHIITWPEVITQRILEIFYPRY